MPQNSGHRQSCHLVFFVLWPIALEPKHDDVTPWTPTLGDAGGACNHRRGLWCPEAMENGGDCPLFPVEGFGGEQNLCPV